MSLLISGLTSQVSYNQGGLRPGFIYLANHSAFNSSGATVTTITGATNTGAIQSITGVPLYRFEYPKNTASADRGSIVEPAPGVKHMTQTVTFTLKNTTQNAKNQIERLGLSRVVAFVIDRNGRSYVLGRQNGLEATVVSSTGAAEGDQNSYVITLSGTENEIAPELIPLGLLTPVQYLDSISVV